MPPLVDVDNFTYSTIILEPQRLRFFQEYRIMNTQEKIRAQLLLARKLILNKQYPEAYELLRTIDHPKAKEWMIKLDQSANSTQSRQIEKPRVDKGCRNTLLLLILLVVLFAVVFALLFPQNNAGTDARRILSREFGNVSLHEDSSVISALIKYDMLPSPRSEARRELNVRLTRAICALRDAGYVNHRFEFDVAHGTVRTGVGTEIPDLVLLITVNANTASDLNCNDLERNGLQVRADEYSWTPPEQSP